MSLAAVLADLGYGPSRLTPLAGDASHRRFVRAFLPGGGTVVACQYPEGQEEQAARDHAVQRWGAARALPIPAPLAHRGRVTVHEDLGDDDLSIALPRLGSVALDGAISTLAEFQACGFADLATAPFDAAFFRRELAGFERFAPGSDGLSAFLDDLAVAVAGHPYRLTHRDFHVNNLFLVGVRVVALDFQDMRGGPDTYDAASLLRERGGAEHVGDEEAARAAIAARCGWTAGWPRRYRECAAQRGLKVIGTFRRLLAEGRAGYGRWLPAVGERTLEALRALDAPGAVHDAAHRAVAGV